MRHKITASVLMVVLAFALTTTTFAQDTKKEADKAEKKPAVLKSASCDPSCGLMVRSHDEDEVVSVMKRHAKKSHNVEMTSKQVGAMVRTESPK